MKKPKCNKSKCKKSKGNENLVNTIREEYPDTMLMDGYDDCIVGICTRFGMEPVVAYDREKVLMQMVKQDGMTYEEAIEFFEYNQIGAWVGERTPVFIDTLNEYL